MNNEKHINALRTVLEFVNRKKCRECDKDVAEAAQLLTDWLNTHDN